MFVRERARRTTLLLSPDNPNPLPRARVLRFGTRPYGGKHKTGLSLRLFVRPSVCTATEHRTLIRARVYYRNTYTYKTRDENLKINRAKTKVRKEGNQTQIILDDGDLLEPANEYMYLGT